MKNFKHYLPVIFTGGAILGVVGSNVITAVQAPKARDAVICKSQKQDKELTKWERFKIAAPYYIPTIVTSAGTILLIVFGSKYSNDIAIKALAAQAGTAAMFKEYVDEAKRQQIDLEDLCGEGNVVSFDDVISREIACKHAQDLGDQTNNTLVSGFPITDTPVRFKDGYSGKFYEATWLEQVDAEYHFNRNLMIRAQNVAEYYEFIGLDKFDFEPSEMAAFEELGWTLDWLYCNDTTFFDFHHVEKEDDDGIYYEVDFMWYPQTNTELEGYM